MVCMPVLDEKPDLASLSPLELPVQGRKCITAQVGDALSNDLQNKIIPGHI